MATLPVAPGGTGQPPSSPKLDSNESMPGLERRVHVGQPLAARVVEVRGQLDVRQLARARASKNSRTWTGLAIPVVSPNPISSAPAAASRSRDLEHPLGLDPALVGQPNETLITPSQRSPASRARASTRSSPVSDSSIERLTFLRLWVSVADRNTLISSKRSRTASALLEPALVRDQHASG